MDAEFKEGNHPRAENGQFGSGGELTFKTSTPDGSGVERTLSKGDWVQPGVKGSKAGPIEGLSTTRGAVKVNGLWHDMRTVEPARAPEPIEVKKEKLSKVLSRNNRKTGGEVEWDAADKVR